MDWLESVHQVFDQPFEDHQESGRNSGERMRFKYLRTANYRSGRTIPTPLISYNIPKASSGDFPSFVKDASRIPQAIGWLTANRTEQVRLEGYN